MQDWYVQQVEAEEAREGLEDDEIAYARREAMGMIRSEISGCSDTPHL